MRETGVRESGGSGTDRRQWRCIGHPEMVTSELEGDIF